MATRRSTTKPKRQRRARSKALSSARNKALSSAPAPALRQDFTPAAAGSDLFELMGNMAARCAELPLRLLRARSPLEVWQEQMLFIQSVTNGYGLAAGMTGMPAPRGGRAAKAKRGTRNTRKR
jgi:hypothetical protein